MLHFDTVTPLLKSTLKSLMKVDVFSAFRLVGGTMLSFQLGHRMSDDIDLFTDAMYNSIDFEQIEKYLKMAFPYVHYSDTAIVGMGKTYRVGNTFKDAVKLDLYYTDKFIRHVVEVDGIRMAHIEDVIAMKIDVIQRGGRKKDFWDIHELLEKYSLIQMVALHKERYPYLHDEHLIISNLINFEKADDEFDPNCLKGKYWEVIKSDITVNTNNYSRNTKPNRHD